MTTARLIDRPFGEGLETMTQLVRDERFTKALADEIRKKGGLDRAFKALHSEFFPVIVEAPTGVPVDPDVNPFQLTVPEILKRLREASEKMGWNIGKDVYEHLAKTAPAWPKGRLAFLSLRIRFGEGSEGVAKTFEAHVDLIRQTFEPKFRRWELLLSGMHPYQGKDVKRLRLLARNATHKPVIEWVRFDLDANRKRKSVTAVRDPKRSLSDEGLVFTWLFREYAPAIDYDKYPSIFLAGYESNVPENDGESWRSVPCVGRGAAAGEVSLGAGWPGHAGSNYSVPTFGK